MVKTLISNSIASKCAGDNKHHRQVASTIPFESESDLIDKFGLITKNTNNADFTRELDSGFGVADIVFFRKRKDWFKSLDLVNIDPRWVYALTKLPYRKSFNIDNFIDITCTSKKSSQKIIDSYVLAGYCKKAGENWIKVKQPRPPVSQIYAIEAKLKDWKRALYQATRYQEFANQSWVLLDSHYSRPAIRHINEFTRRNVGLLTINNNGSIFLASSAKTQAPISNFRYWYSSAKLLNHISTKDNPRSTN